MACGVLLGGWCGITGCSEHGGTAGSEPTPLVALITDFGERDHYVGAMKGAVLTACPDARLVDISHYVPSFDIRAGARILYLAAREFPPGTVFLAVVDPGVGTTRRAVALRTHDDKIFVAPDNGILTLVAEGVDPEEVRVVENRRFMRSGEISRTFHGRDVFGPVAGHLAAGAPFDEVGQPAGDLLLIDFPAAVRTGNVIHGEVEGADTYGNVLTNIDSELVEELGASVGDTLRVRVKGRQLLVPLVNTYAEVKKGEPLALVHSSGRLELAVNQGSMAKRTEASAGSPVEVEVAR